MHFFFFFKLGDEHNDCSLLILPSKGLIKNSTIYYHYHFIHIKTYIRRAHLRVKVDSINGKNLAL